jgi:hypothetical protein
MDLVHCTDASAGRDASFNGQMLPFVPELTDDSGRPGALTSGATLVLDPASGSDMFAAGPIPEKTE